ncbi:hypothetical protein KBD34_04355 [Patescibacteria group bacterium]|nr:hypothetical protein [Patescibacteria group bacterium]
MARKQQSATRAPSPRSSSKHKLTPTLVTQIREERRALEAQITAIEAGVLKLRKQLTDMQETRVIHQTRRKLRYPNVSE